MAAMDWDKYKPVGVQAVDMCAGTIWAHRKRNIPIKAIHLWPRMYDQFRLWVEKQCIKRELEPGEAIEFDSVYIEKGAPAQSTPIVVELYLSNQALA